jgi:outer membrane protein OmpA-like peptidoglycan-associated protein
MIMINNLLLLKFNSLKKITSVVCVSILLSSCAGNDIVKLEASVKQLKDLNDHDRDGVIEAREKCDNTVLGATIDNYGCGKQTTYIVPISVNINFAHDSYLIPTSSISKVQQLAGILQENQDIQVVIEGHTSKVGSAKYNHTLSENRAKAVASLLVDDFNIAPERVSPIGYGFERLADYDDTETAHETNRRIMAELSRTVSVDDMIWTIYTVDQTQ